MYQSEEFDFEILFMIGTLLDLCPHSKKNWINSQRLYSIGNLENWNLFLKLEVKSRNFDLFIFAA